jgi:hypothetical protein
MWDILFPSKERPNSPYLRFSSRELRRANIVFERFRQSEEIWSLVDRWLLRSADDSARQRARLNIQDSVQSYLEYWEHQEAISSVQQAAADSAYSSLPSQPGTPSVPHNSSSRAWRTNYSPTSGLPSYDVILPSRPPTPANINQEPQIPSQPMSILREEEEDGD